MNHVYSLYRCFSIGYKVIWIFLFYLGWIIHDCVDWQYQKLFKICTIRIVNVIACKTNRLSSFPLVKICKIVNGIVQNILKCSDCFYFELWFSLPVFQFAVPFLWHLNYFFGRRIYLFVSLSFLDNNSWFTI